VGPNDGLVSVVNMDPLEASRTYQRMMAEDK
jgi:hypothetical protein